MPVSRDTTADDAARLEQDLRDASSVPPLTLDGADRSQLRSSLDEVYVFLLNLEETTKEWGLRMRIRAQRRTLEVALVLVPKPTRQQAVTASRCK